jgi:hypothetical protein
MAKYLLLFLLTLSFMSGVVVSKLQRQDPNPKPVSAAQPPKSIVICGIEDHPCVHYAISYHAPTGKFGDKAGEGVTDYQAKTISIASSRDSFVNVSTLMHEIYHAALWERGFTEEQSWKLHDWIYFSEGPVSMILHDNPELMRYIANGY